MEEKNEGVNETPQDQQQEGPKPIGALFDIITYHKVEDVSNFLDNMNQNDAMFVLLSSARYGQAKGIYSLEEAEAISKAIRLFTTPPPEQLEENSNTPTEG